MSINYPARGILLELPKQCKTNTYRDRAGDLNERGHLNTPAGDRDVGDWRVLPAKVMLATLLQPIVPCGDAGSMCQVFPFVKIA